MSITGKIDLFVFGSHRSPKEVQKTLAKITGFAPLPPFHSLGYHFSKWSNVSAQMIMTRNEEFEENEFPLDVIWMDIPYTHQGMYFKFDPDKFPVDKHEEMNEMIEESGRRLVVITDPHIKVTSFGSDEVGLKPSKHDRPGARFFVNSEER